MLEGLTLKQRRMKTTQRVRIAPGIGPAIMAYLIWGLLPVYWKALDAVPPVEILAHRIVWSLFFLLLVLRWRGELGALRRLITQGRSLRHHGVAAGLLSANWLIYIHGVNSGRIIETSLGYYINPLVSVFLGVVFLGERMRRVQTLAVAIAAAGVVYLTWRLGRPPWIALALAFTFGGYGLARKKAGSDSLGGLTVETVILSVPALLLILAAELAEHGAMRSGFAGQRTLLVLAGVVTAIPLLLFGHAVRKVPLSTMGMLQYVAPTCGLLLGVFVYHEPFGPQQWAGFVPIWCALLLFSAEAAFVMRSGPRRVDGP